ncbi:MAG: hypothetical protein ACXAB2_06875, partial [Candidatus Hodarchaeales archaeon]
LGFGRIPFHIRLNQYSLTHFSTLRVNLTILAYFVLNQSRNNVKPIAFECNKKLLIKKISTHLHNVIINLNPI